MRLSALLFLLLLAASLGTTRVDTTTAAEKVDQATESESDPCSTDALGTVLCGRIRVPVG